jgi:catechol 2,3-dioxygenase-like lactoylglutathione lyase family enzyme
MIWSEHLQETIDFYTQLLGFTCGEVNEEWGWTALHKDNVEIMVARPNAHIPFEKPVFTGSFYIRTDDVDTL